MINTNLLKSKIIAEGYTQRTLAPAIGMSANSLNAKINGRKAFDTEEVRRLCEVLKINDPQERCQIFLP